MSVVPLVITRLPMDALSWHLCIFFSKNCFVGSQITLKSDKNNRCFEDIRNCTTISRWIPLGMRNVSDRSCRENQNTHLVFKNVSFPKMVNMASAESLVSMEHRFVTTCLDWLIDWLGMTVTESIREPYCVSRALLWYVRQIPMEWLHICSILTVNLLKTKRKESARTAQ